MKNSKSFFLTPSISNWTLKGFNIFSICDAYNDTYF